MTLDASGNLGINTTSPSTFGKVAIQVTGTTTPTSAANVGPSSINLYAATNGSATDGTTGIFGWNAGSPGIGSGIGFSRESSGDWGTQIRFYTHPTATTNIGDITERARINSDGQLLVGTASSYTSYGLIQIRGDNKGIAIIDSTDDSYRAIYNQSGILYFYNGTNEGYLSTAGAWVNASDARLKENIVPIKHGLDSVLKSKPRSFKMKEGDNTEHVGFIAQEMLDVIPECVSGKPEKQLGISYGSLVAVAFKAIQEQQTMIEELTAKVAALEAKQ